LLPERTIGDERPHTVDEVVWVHVVDRGVGAGSGDELIDVLHSHPARRHRLEGGDPVIAHHDAVDDDVGTGEDVEHLPGI
jgi:hypothetical protein